MSATEHLRGMPEISVIVPTYNRASELLGTLTTLAAQDLQTDRYEVVVADDGSRDHTAEVAGRAWPMEVRYTHQEDRGFRAGQARNLGARNARGSVLIFLDSGMRVSRGFLSGHLAAHRDKRPAVVLGFLYGYDNDRENRLDPKDLGWDVDELMDHYRATGKHLDPRMSNFRALEGDLSCSAVPWVLCWTANLSVAAEDFRAVGGFDEDYVGWSWEDVELGIRLHRRSLDFLIGWDAGAVEIPHERDMDALLPSYREHATLTLRKHPDPWVELATIFWAHELDEKVNELRTPLEERARLTSDAFGRGAPPPKDEGALVVFGADALPVAPSAALCVEPSAALATAMAQRGLTIRNVLPHFGFRTLRTEEEFDTALLARSLRSLPGWAVELIEAEAARIAVHVRWLPEDH